MKNYQKMYEKIVEEATFKEEVSKAKEQFTPKPFVSEYYRLKQAALYARPSLSLFSITTGFVFLFYSFEGFLHSIIAACFTFVLLIIVEYAKSETTTLSIRKILMTGKVAHLILLLFALGFFGLSVFFSVNGAKELYLKMDNTIEQHQKLANENKKNIVENYQEKIEAEQQALQDFKSAVSWQGKINLQNQTVAQTLSSYVARIDSLDAQKGKAMKYLEQQNKKEISLLEKQTGFNIFFWVALCLGNECLLLICLVFPVYYQYKTAQESELFANTTSEFTLSWSDLKHFLSNALLHNEKDEWVIPKNQKPNAPPQATSYEFSNTPPPSDEQKQQDDNNIPPQSKSIGFEMKDGFKNRKPRSNSYDHERIKDLIAKGLRVKEIASLLNCSEATIRRARKAK